MPGVLVHIRKGNFAVSSINVFYFCFTFFVQRTFGKRLTVRQRNSVSLTWYRLTFFVLELDRDPMFLVLILFGVWIVPRRAVRSQVRWRHCGALLYVGFSSRLGIIGDLGRFRAGRRLRICARTNSRSTTAVDHYDHALNENAGGID